MVTGIKEPIVVDMLEKLGFKAAAGKVKEAVQRKRKMAIAYEFYRYVRPEKILEFNAKLMKKSHNWDKMGGYHTLTFTPIANYEGAPPMEVLKKLEEAQDRKCFDAFEVGYIREVPDPLLMGVINGCTDKFFIDQWDNDVKIQDILKDNEG